MNGGRALRAFFDGVRIALEHPRLVGALWLCQLVLAAVAALPAFRWLFDVTAWRPVTDALLYRFSLPLFIDLVRTPRGSVLGAANAAIAGAFLVTLLAAPVLLSAVVITIRDRSAGAGDVARRVVGRYGRLLLLITAGRAIAVAGAAAAGVVLAVLLASMRYGAWDWGLYASIGLQIVCVGAVAAWLWATVDVAVCELSAGDAPGVVSAWWRGLTTVIGRPLYVLGVWVAFAVTLVAALLLLVVLPPGPPATRIAYIVLAFVLQQAFVITRIVTRMAVLAAEIRLCRVPPRSVVAIAGPAPGGAPSVQEPRRSGEDI